MKRIEKTMDELGFGIFDYYKKKDEDDYYGIIEFWTDTADQDVPTEIDFDGTAEDFVKKFKQAAENYNVDDEVELYVDMRGKNGVPNTVRELLNDCEEAKETLMMIANKLEKAIQ